MAIDTKRGTPIDRLTKLLQSVAKPKSGQPFGMPQTPFDPLTGRYEPLGDIRQVRAFTIVSEQDDYLNCTNEKGHAVNVLKPLLLRRTLFDGETVNGVAYAYSSATERTADAEDQVLSPAYYVGEIIVAVKRDGIFDPDEDAIADGRKVKWLDLNLAGRSWRPAAEGPAGPAGADGADGAPGADGAAHEYELRRYSTENAIQLWDVTDSDWDDNKVVFADDNGTSRGIQVVVADAAGTITVTYSHFAATNALPINTGAKVLGDAWVVVGGGSAGWLFDNWGHAQLAALGGADANIFTHGDAQSATQTPELVGATGLSVVDVGGTATLRLTIAFPTFDAKGHYAGLGAPQNIDLPLVAGTTGKELPNP